MASKINDIKSTGTGYVAKKTDCDTRIGEIENEILDHNHKYITTQEFTKSRSEIFTARLAQKS